MIAHAFEEVNPAQGWWFRPLGRWTIGCPGRDLVANFLLAVYVAPFGHPSGHDPERFQLIAPYEPNRRTWLDR